MSSRGVASSHGKRKRCLEYASVVKTESPEAIVFGKLAINTSPDLEDDEDEVTVRKRLVKREHEVEATPEVKPAPGRQRNQSCTSEASLL